jgi:nucleoside-triphosphatase
MIILLTGKPGIGKSTVIEKLIRLVEEPASWVVTSAIHRPELGDRGGFAATNSAGANMVISHKTDIKSDVIIGKNHVDVSAVDAMFAGALNDAGKPGSKLTIIDEIGPIQLLSPAFTTALDHVFNSKADMIATIHYSDEHLAPYRNSPHAVLLQVTPENRDMLPGALATLAKQRQHIKQLEPAQQTVFFSLFRHYVNENKPTQLQKLTDNAIDYVLNHQVKQSDSTTWEVAGRHGSYHVSLADDSYSCTCDLYNGRGNYAGQAGDCSHIQAVMIKTAVQNKPSVSH